MGYSLATLHRSRRLSTAALRPSVLLGTSLENISCPQVPISHPDHPKVVVLYGIDYNNLVRPEGDIECINITGGYQQVLDVTRERCKEGIACVFRSDINRLWVKDLSKSVPMNEDANCIAFRYVDFPPSGRRLSTAGLRPVDLKGTPLQDIAFRHTPEAHPDRSDLVVLYGIDFNNKERPEGDIECINITGGYQQVLDITRERCKNGVICVFRSDISELWVKELSKSALMNEDADCIAFCYVDFPSPVSSDGDVDLLLLKKSPEITRFYLHHLFLWRS